MTILEERQQGSDIGGCACLIAIDAIDDCHPTCPNWANKNKTSQKFYLADLPTEFLTRFAVSEIDCTIETFMTEGAT